MLQLLWAALGCTEAAQNDRGVALYLHVPEPGVHQERRILGSAWVLWHLPLDGQPKAACETCVSVAGRVLVLTGLHACHRGRMLAYMSWAAPSCNERMAGDHAHWHSPWLSQSPDTGVCGRRRAHLAGLAERGLSRAPASGELRSQGLAAGSDWACCCCCCCWEAPAYSC